MKISLNELHIKCRNAFRGLGFPHGADEEGAFIIAWLEIHQFEGLKLFSRVPKCRTKGPFPQTISIDENGVVDCSQCCGIAVIPSVFDLVRSRGNEDETNEIVMNHCSQAILFLPLILKYADSRHTWQLVGTDAESSTHITVDTVNGCVSMNSNTRESPQSDWQIKLQRVASLTFDTKNANEKWSFDSLHQQEKQAIENGLEVNEEQWHLVLETARKSLVPASEESRVKGAGGGDSND